MANVAGNALAILLLRGVEGFFNRLIANKQAESQGPDKNLEMTTQLLLDQIKDTSLSPDERRKAKDQLALITNNPYLKTVDLSFPALKVETPKKGIGERMDTAGYATSMKAVPSNYPNIGSPTMHIQAPDPNRRNKIIDVATEENLQPYETNLYLNRYGEPPLPEKETVRYTRGGSQINPKTKERLEQIEAIINTFEGLPKAGTKLNRANIDVMSRLFELKNKILDEGALTRQEMEEVNLLWEKVPAYAPGFLKAIEYLNNVTQPERKENNSEIDVSEFGGKVKK